MFADVRTYWSSDAVKRATGKGLTGIAKDGIIHLLNSGSCCLDAAGEMKEKGKRVFKNWWEVSKTDMEATLKATKWVPAGVEYFRGGGFSSSFLTPKGMPLTMTRISIVKGQGPVLQIAEGWSVTLDPKQQETLMLRPRTRIVAASRFGWQTSIRVVIVVVHACACGDEIQSSAGLGIQRPHAGYRPTFGYR